MTNPQIIISYNDHHEEITMDLNVKIVSLDVPTQQGALRISRNEPIIAPSHVTHIRIDRLILDDFWEINCNNDPSFTEYDEDYIEHARNSGASWEITKDRHNNVLFFNGSIRYDIRFPLRSMFWL